ncbi:hypothetical protein [Salinicoccus sp. HZC-1]|uniref:hypothetical protein n=1 Tax=Salinicoccus sp. HZC-1 TaxID=3385497 RepID=UPI00398A7DD8
MKRILLLALMAGLLTACGNEDGSTNEESTETDGEQNASQETAEEQDQKEETEETAKSAADASEIIDEAISAWGDTSSYEARQTFTISSEDTQTVVRTITTQSEQDEVKIEVDNGSNVITHYVIDGDHFTYQDGSINPEKENIDMTGSTYGEIIKKLESFKEGKASNTDAGYEIRYPIESAEDASLFLDDEILSSLDDANSLNGLITLHFNDEYQYTGGKLTLTVETEGREINLISNIDLSRIGDIEVIEKPKNM